MAKKGFGGVMREVKQVQNVWVAYGRGLNKGVGVTREAAILDLKLAEDRSQMWYLTHTKKTDISEFVKY